MDETESAAVEAAAQHGVAVLNCVVWNATSCAHVLLDCLIYWLA